MNLPAWLRMTTLKFFRRSELADEMEEELRSHIEHRADDLERSGMSRAEAERRARVEFGAQGKFREESYAALGCNFIQTLMEDLPYSLRVLRKSPGFAIAAITTLTLAIGANAVVFGVLDGVLQPLPVPHPRSLYVAGRAGDNFGYESYPTYIDLRDRNHSFDQLAADDFAEAGLDTGDGPTIAWGYKTSGNYFDVLGVQPYLGRFFHPADEHGPDSAPYVVLTYECWHTRFHDDHGAVGRTVRLNKHPFTIIGVAQPNFRGTFVAMATDFFVPIVNQDQVDGVNVLNDRGNRWVSEVLGHLKAGVTPSQAIADLNSIGGALEKEYPKDESVLRFALKRPGLADTFGGAIRAFLAGLMLLAGLILLAACANLGGLFAARASDRSREIALRLALGSSRARVLRAVFTEAVLVSLAGGALGLWGSVILLNWLSAWQPFPEFPMNLPVSPDADVYWVALLLSLASGFLFGAVPVKQVLRTLPYQVIKQGNSDSAGRRVTIRDVLLVLQIAVCGVLVTSSLVAMRGLARSMHSKLGIDPQNAMLVNTDLGKAGYSSDAIAPMQRRMIDAMKSIPGVKEAALVGPYPTLHMGWIDANVFTDQTTDLKPANAATDTIEYSISPDYLRAAGTMLLAGRAFTWHDDQDAPQMALINQVFARKIFGSAENAIGRHFKIADGTRIEVAGIVENGKYTANMAEDPQPAMFRPVLQSPQNDTWLVLRSSRNPQQLAAAIRRELHGLDPGLPTFIQTWNQEMNGALFASRMATLSLGVLGLMGAMLSITGIFGMAAYSVSKRLKELGIRVALGAQRMELLRSALGRAIRLLAIGSAAGLVFGLLASRVLASIVYLATPRDPLVLGGVLLAMALLGLVATWLPAQRALQVDPLALLREE